MTTRIDRAQIEHVALLASLILTEGESERLTRELAEMVGYVDELNELDTSNVAPMTSVLPANAGAAGSGTGAGSEGSAGSAGSAAERRDEWRPDAIEPSLATEEVLAQAPRSEHGGFAVPTFVES